MKGPIPVRRANWLMIAALAFAAACGDSPLAPFSPEIANNPDNFQFQITEATAVTTVAEYNWSNSGTMANVNQSTAITAGAATLVIRDAGGTEVYRRSLTEGGTFPTSTGTAGVWRIRVEFSQLAGTVNFRVQKGP